MGKMFGLALMIVAIWVGMEVYTEGPDRAFGGLFSFASSNDATADRAVEYVSTPRRVGAKVDRLVRENERRYEELVAE